jgi:hypothetical protein
VVLSIAALTVTAVVVANGVLVGVFSLAFLDSCSPPLCSQGGAWAAVGSSVVVAAVLGIVGLAVTVVRLTRRRMAWPFAVGTLMVAVLVLAAGAAGYAAAVG